MESRVRTDVGTVRLPSRGGVRREKSVSWEIPARDDHFGIAVGKRQASSRT